jgi:hypothetical protein
VSGEEGLQTYRNMADGMQENLMEVLRSSNSQFTQWPASPWQQLLPFFVCARVFDLKVPSSGPIAIQFVPSCCRIEPDKTVILSGLNVRSLRRIISSRETV